MNFCLWLVESADAEPSAIEAQLYAGTVYERDSLKCCYLHGSGKQCPSDTNRQLYFQFKDLSYQKYRVGLRAQQLENIESGTVDKGSEEKRKVRKVR